MNWGGVYFPKTKKSETPSEGREAAAEERVTIKKRVFRLSRGRMWRSVRVTGGGLLTWIASKEGATHGDGGRGQVSGDGRGDESLRFLDVAQQLWSRARIE